MAGERLVRRGREGGFVLPEGFYGRVALSLTCLTLGCPAFFSLYVMIVLGRRPAGVVAGMLWVLLESLAFWLSVFCVVGLVWAAARPQWADRFLRAAAEKVMLGLGLFVLFCFPFAMWALWRA